MAEWQIEAGIGEHRAVLVEHGRVIAARLDWPGGLAAGAVIDAVLIARASGQPRGTARAAKGAANGEEVLVDGLAANAAEGAPLRLLITRSAMAERGRTKRAQARPSERAPAPAPPLAKALAKDLQAKTVRALPDWDELWGEAFTGEVTFAGGAMRFEPTSALTAVDIDGTLPPLALGLAAVPPLAAALRRFDLGGTVVVDFPTLSTKAERQQIDAALAAALADWPHERLAMNGFGLVLLVARLERPSLLHRLAYDPVGAAARLLLRRAEAVTAPGVLELTAPQRVRDAITPAWLAELARRSGRTLTWRIDNTLALPGVFAQALNA